MIHRVFLFCILSAFSTACTSNTKPPSEIKKEKPLDLVVKTSVGPFGFEGKGKLQATIITSDGNLDCELFEKEAPKTVRNFVMLGMGKKDWKDPHNGTIRSGRPFYTDLLFFRIVPGFFLQSGDPTNSGKGGPGYEFDDEFSETLKHDRPGILSMANHGPNTNGSQFFVLLKATPHLDGHHSVFGHCSNLEVLRKLAAYPVNTENVPIDPPKILRVEFTRDDKLSD